jgi:hypothetical protein
VPDKVGAFSPSNTFPSGDFDDSAAGAAAEPTAPTSPVQGSLLVNDPRSGAPMSRIDPGPMEER